MSEFLSAVVRLAVVAGCCLPLTSSRLSLARDTGSPEVRKAIAVANKFFSGHDFEQALAQYAEALNTNPKLSPLDKTSLLIGLANCHLALQQHSLAQKYYEEAAQLALEFHFRERQIIIAGNRASLYRRMGDHEAAQSVLRDVEALIPFTRNALVLSQAARALQDVDFDRAMRLYWVALDAAQDQRGEVRGGELVKASIWNQVGWACLQKGDLQMADRAFTESYRLRVMNRPVQMHGSYYYLGTQRRRAGRLQEARTLLLRALETSPIERQIPIAWVEYELALAAAGSGDLPLALKHFENADEASRTWRYQMLPAERFRLSAEVGLKSIFDDHVRTGMTLYERTGNQTLAARMFEVAEQSRSAVFEQSLLSSAELPAEYWQILGKYRQLLVRSLTSDDNALAEETARLRVRLADMEARVGFETTTEKKSHQKSERTSGGHALAGLQRKLTEQDAFLSFHTGEEATYVWAVTRRTFEVHRLPGREELGKRVRDFRRLLRSRDPGARPAGSTLATMLLKGLGANVRSRKHWILSLDGPLFELPFAALPHGDGGWLGQQHAFRLVPGVAGDGSAEVRTTDQFVGWGDPLYNRADPRWKGKPPATIDFQLERLPGSGRELEVCSRAWTRDRNPLIKVGLEVGRQELLDSLKQSPGVVHLAAHVVPHPRRADQLLIALGAMASGEAQFLSAAEIAALRARVGLVTLSGCGSASGEAVAGVGLFGMIRSWLVAGAQAVVATHWPITDDDGFLLASMYRQLAGRSGPITPAAVSEALQAAQGSMIAAGGWRADPSYWSAFAVTGKD